MVQKGIEFPISILVFLFASLHANIVDFINSNRNASSVNESEREREMHARVSKGEFNKSGNTCSIGDKGNILRHFCVHSVWPSSCLNACKWNCFSRSDLLCAHTRKRIHSNRSFCIFLQWMIVAKNFQKIFFFCCCLKFYCFLFTGPFSLLQFALLNFRFFLSFLNAFFLSSLLIMILCSDGCVLLLFFFPWPGKIEFLVKTKYCRNINRLTELSALT